MDKEGNRRKVWDAFQKALSRDRARTNVTKISELGLVEMTRKRTRESLVQLLTEPCPTCEGAGVVKSVDTVAYEILREVRRSGMIVDNEKIEIECAPRVAEILSAPGARLPRLAREAVPEADHRRRPEGLEAGPVPGRRQDVDRDRGRGRGRGADVRPCATQERRPARDRGPRGGGERRWRWRWRRGGRRRRRGGRGRDRAARTPHEVGVKHRISIAREQYKFSCAHMTVFADGTKERLHGHNYTIARRRSRSTASSSPR